MNHIAFFVSNAKHCDPREFLGELLAPSDKRPTDPQNLENTDSENENAFLTNASTTIRPKTTVQNTTPVNSCNMVTGVFNDSTNLGAKRPKQLRSLSHQDRDRPTRSRLLFAPQSQIHQPVNALPMPKSLTASLPVFEGKSEKFELFEDLFRNKNEMYPHLTEIRKINYFHSLLRGKALQAHCNLDDA